MSSDTSIRIIVVPVSVALAILLAATALWLSPNDPDRIGNPRGGGGQLEHPVTGLEKAQKIWNRVISGESWTYGRKPVWEPLGDALPRTLRINFPGLLLGWLVGSLLGCWAGALGGRLIGRILCAMFLLSAVIPAPIWVCCCRMVLIETGLFRLSDGGVVPAILTVSVLTATMIALNQSVLVGRAVRRPEIRFAKALGLPFQTRWQLILRSCRAYWWSELALLAVAFCEGSMLVERVFGVKGVGDAMYLACTKADPSLVIAIVGSTAILVNFGVVTTNWMTAVAKGKEGR